MIKNVGDHYLVEGLLDHKLTRDVGGVALHIEKSYENNLRERNPILGIVRGVSKTNPLNLKEGDHIIVSHFSFYRNIGDNRGFQSNIFVEADGKKLFRIHPNDIYFTCNNEEIQPVGTIIGVERVEDSIESFGIISTVKHANRGRVIYPNCGVEIGTEVLLENHALYEIEYNKKKFCRIRENEIVGIIHEEEIRDSRTEDLAQYSDNPLLVEMLQKTAKLTGKKTVTPYKGRIVVKDLYVPTENEIKHPDVFFAPRDYDAEVVAVGEMTEKQKIENSNIRVGDQVFRVRKSGIQFENLSVCSMSDDSVHFIYKT